MRIALLALLGFASASIEVPENDVDSEALPSLIIGEQQTQKSDALAASALLETHTAVQSNQNLRAKIVAAMSKNTGKSQQMQSVTLSASANLLGPEKSKSMVQSLMQTDMDSSMNQAVQMAVSMKTDKRVTLEELLVVEDKAKDTMDTVAGSLTGAFSEMMAGYKQCAVCKSDCQALEWKKYQVHTMAECQKNCKINVCKEASKEEAAQFEEERQQAPKYTTSKFSSYIEDYSKAHGQEGLTVDDEDKFDIVWEVPGSDVAVEKEIGSNQDPVEYLRAIDKSVARKSTEDTLKLLHMEAEANKKERFVSALQ